MKELERMKDAGKDGLLQNMIHKSNDPGLALEIAVKVILGFLARPQSFAVPFPGSPAEQGETVL